MIAIFNKYHCFICSWDWSLHGPHSDVIVFIDYFSRPARYLLLVFFVKLFVLFEGLLLDPVPERWGWMLVLSLPQADEDSLWGLHILLSLSGLDQPVWYPFNRINMVFTVIYVQFLAMPDLFARKHTKDTHILDLLG